MLNVLGEELFYHYLRADMTLVDKREYEDIVGNDVVERVITFAVNEIAKLEKEKKHDAAKSIRNLINTAVLLEETQKASHANETMEQDRKFITIVVDSKKKPVGYITTGDIRRMLLSLPDLK